MGKWIQSGTFWRVDQFTPLLANGNYPQNGDVVFLAVVLPWHNDAFVALVNPVYVTLAGLAAFALGRELGAPRATALLATAVFVALPVVGLGTKRGRPRPTPMMRGRAGRRRAGPGPPQPRRACPSDLALAGVALDLSLGTKWYATWAVVAVPGGGSRPSSGSVARPEWWLGGRAR